MLRKPKKLARLVAGLAAGLDIPLTVKVWLLRRLEWQRRGGAGCREVQEARPLALKNNPPQIRLGADSNINVEEVVPLLEAAGAAAVTIHGRTMQVRGGSSWHPAPKTTLLWLVSS